ncbi:MAG: PilZ domain-containing protein [Candidatus Omnitrophica bacterium]|nr:PilZ domain-containing protein [Candidatus Omnitrophota bacterium]
MVQNRVYKRIEDLVEVEFILNITGTTTVIRTKTRDISAGGLKVYLNHQLQQGHRMQLSITLPHTKDIVKAEAEVVCSDLIAVVGDRGEEMLFETRFKFLKMSLELKNAITHYVFECRRKTHDAKIKT